MFQECNLSSVDSQIGLAFSVEDCQSHWGSCINGTAYGEVVWNCKLNIFSNFSCCNDEILINPFKECRVGRFWWMHFSTPDMQCLAPISDYAHLPRLILVLGRNITVQKNRWVVINTFDLHTVKIYEVTTVFRTCTCVLYIWTSSSIWGYKWGFIQHFQFVAVDSVRLKESWISVVHLVLGTYKYKLQWNNTNIPKHQMQAREWFRFCNCMEGLYTAAQ